MSNREHGLVQDGTLPSIKPTAKMPPVKPPKPESKPNDSSLNCSSKNN